MKAVHILACLAVIVAVANAQGDIACTDDSDCASLNCGGHATDFVSACHAGECHCHSTQTCSAHHQCTVHCHAHQQATCDHRHCHCDYHHQDG